MIAILPALHYLAILDLPSCDFDANSCLKIHCVKSCTLKKTNGTNLGNNIWNKEILGKKPKSIQLSQSFCLLCSSNIMCFLDMYYTNYCEPNFSLLFLACVSFCWWHISWDLPSKPLTSFLFSSITKEWCVFNLIILLRSSFLDENI